jgi:hypothetical protein
MAHIKITFLIIFFDRVPQLPAFNGFGYKINSENTLINIFYHKQLRFAMSTFHNIFLILKFCKIKKKNDFLFGILVK